MVIVIANALIVIEIHIYLHNYLTMLTPYTYYMHDVHFIVSYSISVYSFLNGNKSHLPNLYKIQESHLIIP